MAAKTGDRKGRLKDTPLKDSENEENRQETYTRAVTQLWLHERRTLSAKWKLEWRRVTKEAGRLPQSRKDADGGARRVWKKEGPVNGSGAMATKPMNSQWHRRTAQGLPSGA